MSFACVVKRLTGFVAKNHTVDITISHHSAPVSLTSIFGWIVIHQHLGSTLDWQLSFDNYTAGFGSIDANFWLGLHQIHLLTSSTAYRLRVELQQMSTNLWYSAEYWTFTVGAEWNDYYRLEVSGYSGDAGNSLQYDVYHDDDDDDDDDDHHHADDSEDSGKPCVQYTVI